MKKKGSKNLKLGWLWHFLFVGILFGYLIALFISGFIQIPLVALTDPIAYQNGFQGNCSLFCSILGSLVSLIIIVLFIYIGNLLFKRIFKKKLLKNHLKISLILFIIYSLYGFGLLSGFFGLFPTYLSSAFSKFNLPMSVRLYSFLKPLIQVIVTSLSFYFFGKSVSE